MALADITIADGQGTPVNHTFAYVRQVGARVVRTELAAAAEEPWDLTIAHSEETRNGVKMKSHLFRVDLTVLDDDGVTPYTANGRFAVSIPVAIQSDALADDIAALFRNWLTSNNVRALVKGSVF